MIDNQSTDFRILLNSCLTLNSIFVSYSSQSNEKGGVEMELIVEKLLVKLSRCPPPVPFKSSSKY